MAARSEASSYLAPIAGDAIELDPRNARWLAFAADHPDALAFHRPGWSDLLSDCYGFRTFVIAALDAYGEIVGGIPVCEVRRFGKQHWVSLPFTDSCPPLLRDDRDRPGFTLAFDRARESAGISTAEIRSFLTDLPHVRTEAAAVTHTLALDGTDDELFRRFHRSQVQRNIRKAEREPLELRLAERARDLTHTYYGLHAQTRRRLGAPVQPRRFFIALWELLVEPGYGHVYLVYSKSRPIAGAVFLAGSTTITYKYGASDAAFWPLRPNHLLFWTAIRQARREGFSTVDFGRSDIHDSGLRSFKSGWGTLEEPLSYATLANRPRPARAIAPPQLTRVLLRRSPTWLCRAAGEILYRYAA